MYELRCLGEATLRSPSGELVHFRSRKHLALLIYMALNADRAHRRERLAAMLWSDSDESKARHSLSQALYAVRRLLNGAVCIEGDDLELKTDGLYVDALELEQFFDTGDVASAADMYKGDFLEGFWVRGAQGFEEWIFHERARFSALARDALRKAITTARAAADWPEVSARAERLVRLDPFDEAAYSELMRALWMQGDRSAALDRYADLCRVLDSDLKTSPSKETEALASRIRERSVRGGWTSQAMLRETESALFLDPPFVGRKRELAALSKEWSVVSTGESRTVALVGGAGIGKTRLATEFMKSLELDDNTILRGRCYEAEQSLPYGPIAEALRLGLAELDLEDVNPLWLAELARIVPEAHERFGELPEPAELDAEGGRRRLYEGIAQVFRGACDARPILLFVDDLHWADESSLALLHYLHRRVTNGLYILAAYRPEELSTQGAGVGGGLLSQSNPAILTTHVAALDTTDSSDLLASVMGEESDARTRASLLQMSGGNPFFAIELARSLNEGDQLDNDARPQVPASIRSLLNRRFDTLSDRAAALVYQAAFLGTRVNYKVLSEATGLPPLEVDSIFREVRRVGLMIEDGGVASFRHDLIREVADSQVPQAIRPALHIRAARALIETDGSPAEIASHFSYAGDQQEATEWATKGAEAAENIFAFREAAELLELALRNCPDGERRQSLSKRIGTLYMRICDYEKARPFFEGLLAAAARNEGSAAGLIEARRDMLQLDIYSGSLSMEESGQTLRALYSDLIESDGREPILEARILTTLFWTAARCFDAKLAEEAIEKLRLLHQRCEEPEIRYRTARSLGIYERYKGRLQEAQMLLTQAVETAEALGDSSYLADAYVGLSTLLSRSMSRELATQILNVAVPTVEKNVDPRRLTTILANCAVYYTACGNFDLAEELLQRAQKVLDMADDTSDLATSISYTMGHIADARGDTEAAQQYWNETLKTSTEGGVLPGALESYAALGRLALQRGEVTNARLFAARALRLARKGKYLADERFGLEQLLADLRHESGRSSKALHALTETALRAVDSDVPLYLAAQLSRVRILVREDRVEEAHIVAEELTSIAEQVEALWWQERAESVLRQRPNTNTT